MKTILSTIIISPFVFISWLYFFLIGVTACKILHIGLHSILITATCVIAPLIITLALFIYLKENL